MDQPLQTAMAAYQARQYDAAGAWRSPWYPGLRLFRQKSRGNWASVLDAVAANLNAWPIRCS